MTETSEDAPMWWQRIQSTWFDEIFGVLLVGIGLLSFLTLLSPSGELGTAWASTLSNFFGLGAFIISLMIIAGGTLLLLPKIGIFIPLNWWRIITGEVTFLLALAYLHANIRAQIGGQLGEIEALARALEGRGGGLVGWAIQEGLHLLLGDSVTGAVLLGGLVVFGMMTLGIRKRHFIQLLDRVENSLVRISGIEASEYYTTPAAALPDAGTAADVASETPFIGLESVEDLEQIAVSPTGTPYKMGRPSILSSELEINRAPEDRETMIARLLEEGLFHERFKLGEVKEKRKVRKRKEALPSLELLDDKGYARPSDNEINYCAHIIEDTISDFGMEVEVKEVKAGPTITQYAIQPFTHIEKNGKKVVQRVRVSKLATLGQDLALALSVSSVRIQAPIPGTNYIGIEVPNRDPGIVSLRPVVESPEYYAISRQPLAVALGREVDGTPVAIDLAKMPHLLIGGTTGSGKSVALRSMATCLLANNSPDELRLVMLDPKMVEMIRFNGVPHLYGRVEVEVERIIGVLRWVTREMDRRYKLMEEAQARNLTLYNKGRRKSSRLPHMVVFIDELAELMSEHPEQTEPLLTRLAQMARATGIHLVVATQRPSTEVVTGLIKANFPARIAFNVTSNTDSRVVLDSVGAEELIGRGDMLYQAPDAMAPVRLQGSFISDRETEAIIQHWRDNWEDHDDLAPAPWQRALTRAAILQETDSLLIDAIKLVQNEREASASSIQRKLNVGYPRAARIMDMLYKLGIVGEEESGGRTRSVLIDKDADPIKYIEQQRRKKK